MLAPTLRDLPPDASVSENGAMSFVKFTSLNYRDPVNPTFAYTSYSAKFTLNGMTGIFNSTVQAQISGVASSPTAASTPAAAAGTTTTPGASATAKTTAVASAAKSASAIPTANGAIGVTAPGVVSSTIGRGMVMSFASFFLGVLAFGL